LPTDNFPVPDISELSHSAILIKTKEGEKLIDLTYAWYALSFPHEQSPYRVFTNVREASQYNYFGLIRQDSEVFNQIVEKVVAEDQVPTFKMDFDYITLASYYKKYQKDPSREMYSSFSSYLGGNVSSELVNLAEQYQKLYITDNDIQLMRDFIDGTPRYEIMTMGHKLQILLKHL